MRVRQTLAPVLALAVIAGLAAAIVISYRGAQQARRAEALRTAVVVVHGLVGSEKRDFLTDPRVTAILLAHEIELHVDTAGSRDIANRTDLKNYDFGFPAGVPAAKRLAEVVHAKTTFSPFYTPMVVASWRPIAEILAASGIVHRDGDAYYIVDIPKLLAAMTARKRWNEFPHSDAYAIGKSVLISSTDVRSSNSAAMYLSLASYVLNGNEVVHGPAEVARIAPLVAPLFTRQGYQESSSAGPFEDYTTIGIGKSPLVMIYEAQFIEYLLEHPQARDPNMVLLYPKPTVYTKHVLVPFDDAGAKVGMLLANDPELQRLAVEHGLRTADADYAQTFWKSHGVRAPRTLIDVVDPPDYESLEAMIRQIEHAFTSG